MIVIVHPTDGVYVGCALGLAFFARLDNAGQSTAATFESETQARAHVYSWNGDADPDEFAYHEVACASFLFATVEEMLSAGIPSRHLGDMLNNVRTVGPVQ